jgi:RNA polymerase sigma factor (sigma-70 family)
LLDRFLTQRDDAAFEALLKRHGGMVLGVCRRILRNEADAHDAFQATFLVFIRKAATIEPRAMVGNWLYGVAHRTSLKAKAMNRQRDAKERLGAARRTDLARDEALLELQALLDQELSRLPDRYRAPVVLCELEGKSLKEAARQLDCPPGTVASRLARGRELLGRRLTKQGLALSGGLLALALAREAAAAVVPTTLHASTVQSALVLAAGTTAATGIISANVASLLEGVLKSMLLTKLKSVVAVMAVVALVGTGGTVATYRAVGAEPTVARHVALQSPAAAQDENPKPAKSKDDKPPSAERTNGYLGVMLKDDDDKRTVLVHEVFPDSPAAKAGVRADDIVLKVADKSVSDTGAAVDILKKLKPGDKVALQLKRGDKELAMTITLGKWPADFPKDGSPKPKSPPQAKNEAGFLGLILDYDANNKTVVVHELYPDSPAVKAGCKAGDVILKVDKADATDAEGVVKQLSGLHEGDKVTLRIKRGEKEMDLTITAAKRPADFGTKEEQAARDLFSTVVPATT